MYNPYAKGRWFRVFIESDGNTPTITDSDIPVENSTQYIKFPKDFHVIDVKYDVNSTAGETVANMDVATRYYNDNAQAVSLPPVAHYDYMYLYVFGYYAD